MLFASPSPGIEALGARELCTGCWKLTELVSGLSMGCRKNPAMKILKYHVNKYLSSLKLHFLKGMVLVSQIQAHINFEQ